MMKNIGGFFHLDHERGLAARQRVRGTDPGEDPVDHADTGFGSGNEATHLGENYDQRHLAHVRRFAGHIRPREHENLIRLRIDDTVVWNESAPPDKRLDHRVTPLTKR